MPSITGTRLGQSQERGIQSKYPTQMAGTQLIAPSPLSPTPLSYINKKLESGATTGNQAQECKRQTS